MTKTPERHVARLLVPAQLAGPRRGRHQVRLLDLSPRGARIELIRQPPDWTLYLLDLPRALGGIRRQGEVLWSWVSGYKAVGPGDWLVVYQSELTFRWLTPEQRAGRTAVLERLSAAQAAPPPA